MHTGFAVDAAPGSGSGDAVFAAVHVDVPGGRRVEATGWASRAAFDASAVTPHALQYRATLGPMLGALYDERLYRRLSR